MTSLLDWISTNQGVVSVVESSTFFAREEYEKKITRGKKVHIPLLWFHACLFGESRKKNMCAESFDIHWLILFLLRFQARSWKYALEV